ncbi:hypothetical protein PR048_014236 [Dryococelus australis]|uniref:Uncharacterized protein n=1 Tax=Dryococelus australis TaxID=614101 RepID=A0ABQ9HEE2_9NEOP|nr:hypothetical protein PR048_014236 [Dryococelus australis]
MKIQGKREILEETCRPAASSGIIPTCENPGVTQPGIEPGSPRWETSMMVVVVLTSLEEDPFVAALEGHLDSENVPSFVHHLPILYQVCAVEKTNRNIEYDIAATAAGMLADNIRNMERCFQKWLIRALDYFQHLTRVIVYTDLEANRVRFQARLLLDFRKRESCRTMLLVGEFSRGSPISNALAFRRCSILTSFDPCRLSRPHAKICPNLSTLVRRPEFTLIVKSSLESTIAARRPGAPATKQPATRTTHVYCWKLDLLDLYRRRPPSWRMYCAAVCLKYTFSHETVKNILGWSGTGMQIRKEREYPEKASRQVASSSTIPACENPGVNPLGIEPGTPWWEVSALATAPPLPHTDAVNEGLFGSYFEYVNVQ